MSKFDGMAPDLTPEEQEAARRSIERMIKRHREGRYRAGRPGVPEKQESMAPWMQVSGRPLKPPVPIPGFETDDDDAPAADHEQKNDD
jgi:hypothetical protein